jgi:hypothetical protein
VDIDQELLFGYTSVGDVLTLHKVRKETCYSLLRFSSAMTFLFYSGIPVLTHQEEHVADGEAFQDVGEARLQLHALLGEHEHADDVSCDWSASDVTSEQFNQKERGESVKHKIIERKNGKQR